MTETQSNLSSQTILLKRPKMIKRAFSLTLKNKKQSLNQDSYPWPNSCSSNSQNSVLWKQTLILEARSKDFRLRPRSPSQKKVRKKRKRRKDCLLLWTTPRIYATRLRHRSHSTGPTPRNRRSCKV